MKRRLINLLGVSRDMTRLMTAALSIDCSADDLIDILKTGERVDATSSSGMTALHWAARTDECGEAKDRARRIKILVKAGADVEATDDRGQTPLMHAAEDGGTGQVRALLEAGANPNSQDRRGTTPLMIALDGWRACEKVPLLLQFGAKIEIQDAEQKNALDHARYRYEMWKGITEEQGRPGVRVEDLLDQIPAHIQGRLKPATLEAIRIDLSEALTRKRPGTPDSARFLTDAECVLRALESCK